MRALFASLRGRALITVAFIVYWNLLEIAFYLYRTFITVDFRKKSNRLLQAEL